MSLHIIESNISKLEELFYNIDLSIFECPDIKTFTIEFPKIIKSIRNEINNNINKIELDFINVQQLNNYNK